MSPIYCIFAIPVWQHPNTGNDMIKGLFYILLFYYIGELISMFIGNFIPGSIIGMILLFLALFFKVLNPDNVRGASTLIVKNMAIFFVPAAVGLMVYGDLLMQSIPIIVAAIGISTILTIASVALTQEHLEKRNNRRNDNLSK